MALPNVFDKAVSDQLIARINKLTPESTPLWGKMSAPQMLAHCNVTYEMCYEDIHPKPGFIGKVLLNLFVKNQVISEKNYGKNLRTGPQFLVTDNKDFEKEKQRLIDYINRTQKLGANAFEQKESHSFGKLSSIEWNNMFYKHLNHHLEQFGL